MVRSSLSIIVTKEAWLYPPYMTDNEHKRRPAMRWVALSIVLISTAAGIWQGLVHPNTPLKPEWNPLLTLRVTDPVTPITSWKLSRALAKPDTCLAVLDTGADAKRMPDLTESAQCHIRPQVDLNKVGQATLRPLKTRCQTALRMAMWEQHGIQPAALALLGQNVRQITHFSSYNCRQIRTRSGATSRMSTHATADSIDVSGFVMADGQRITLLDDWDGTADRAAFLRAVRDSACDWFRVTLGPDYNTLHANHFHLQHTGWGLCR